MICRSFFIKYIVLHVTYFQVVIYDCINFLLLCNKSPQIQQHKTTPTYHLTVSMGQDSRHILPAFSSQSFISLKSRCQPGLQYLLRLGIFFSSSMVLYWIKFLAYVGLKPSGLRGHPLLPARWPSSSHGSLFLQGQQESNSVVFCLFPVDPLWRGFPY